MAGTALLVTGCAGAHFPVVATNSDTTPGAPCAATGTAYVRTELFCTAYDKTFHQQAVLREDDPPSCVLF